MFVAPTEPTQLKSLGTVNMMPERFGVDYLWPAHGAWAGVQRKEVSDLLASATDGRLAKELSQMEPLIHRWVVIEGTVRFTGEGELMMGRARGKPWSRDQWEGMVASIQQRGCWLASSSDVRDTGRVIGILQRWSRKEKHTSLTGRPGPVSLWGRPGSRDWAIHLLQGFEGIGPELATRIIDTFGGVPMQWTVDEAALRGIEGLGPKKVKKLMEALNG